jgi:hypothetical protein
MEVNYLKQKTPRKTIENIEIFSISDGVRMDGKKYGL